MLKQFKKIQKSFKELLARNEFDTKVRLGLYEKLASGLEEGVSVPQSLTDLERRYRRKKDPMAYMLAIWLSRFGEGQNFSEAIKGWVPENDIYIINAGEEKGGDGLEKALKDLIQTTEESRAIQRLIKKEVFPKLVSFGALLGIVYFFSRFLAPEFKGMTPEENWPDLARNYFAVSDYILANGAWIGAVIGVVLVLITWTFKNLKGPVRSKLDHMPPWTIYREMESAKFLIVLSSMVRSGIGTNEAISKMEKFANPYVKYHMKKMRQKLNTGIDDGSALDTGMLTEDLADDAKDYGQRSGFAKGIERLGKRSAQDIIHKVEDSVSKIGGIIDKLIYAYLGLSFFVIFTMVDALKKSLQM